MNHLARRSFPCRLKRKTNLIVITKSFPFLVLSTIYSPVFSSSEIHGNVLGSLCHVSPRCLLCVAWLILIVACCWPTDKAAMGVRHGRYWLPSHSKHLTPHAPHQDSHWPTEESHHPHKTPIIPKFVKRDKSLFRLTQNKRNWIMGMKRMKEGNIY